MSGAKPEPLKKSECRRVEQTFWLAGMQPIGAPQRFQLGGRNRAAVLGHQVAQLRQQPLGRAVVGRWIPRPAFCPGKLRRIGGAPIPAAGVYGLASSGCSLGARPTPGCNAYVSLVNYGPDALVPPGWLASRGSLSTKSSGLDIGTSSTQPTRLCSGIDGTIA